MGIFFSKFEKKKKKKIETYGRYYRRILDAVPTTEYDPEEMQISRSVVLILNDIMTDFFHRVSTEASVLSRRHGRRTLLVRDIETAVKVVMFPVGLQTEAVNEGRRAVAEDSMTRNAKM